MKELLKFKVAAADGSDDEVFLEVNPSVLTDELATEINTFWGAAAARLEEQDGNVLQTVVRLFGAQAISYMRADGGASFGDDEADGEKWTRRVLELDAEGWPEYEQLGIRVLHAYVEGISYWDVELTQVPYTSSSSDGAKDE